jgi:hypothetical protein
MSPPFPPLPEDPRPAFLTHPTVRNDDPNPADWGVVSRVITGLTAPLLVDQLRPTIGLTSIVTDPGDTSTVLLAAANYPPSPPAVGGRRGLYIFNYSRTRFLYVLLNNGPATVSVMSFTARVPPLSLFTLQWPPYTGPVYGAWLTGPVTIPSYALVTEESGPVF